MIFNSGASPEEQREFLRKLAERWEAALVGLALTVAYLETRMDAVKVFEGTFTEADNLGELLELGDRCQRFAAQMRQLARNLGSAPTEHP